MNAKSQDRNPQWVNEKGLTLDQYCKAGDRMFRNRGIVGLGLTAALSLGNIFYQDSTNVAPQRPQNYQTYVDAVEDLSTLINAKNALSDRYEIRDLDYALSRTKKNVSEMEPEMRQYEDQLKNRGKSIITKGIFPSIVTTILGIVGTFTWMSRGIKKLGSNNFEYKTSGGNPQ